MFLFFFKSLYEEYWPSLVQVLIFKYNITKMTSWLENGQNLSVHLFIYCCKCCKIQMNNFNTTHKVFYLKLA